MLCLFGHSKPGDPRGWPCWGRARLLNGDLMVILTSGWAYKLLPSPATASFTRNMLQVVRAYHRRHPGDSAKAKVVPHTHTIYERRAQVTSGSGKSHQGRRITMAQPVSSIIKSSRSIAHSDDFEGHKLYLYIYACLYLNLSLIILVYLFITTCTCTHEHIEMQTHVQFK